MVPMDLYCIWSGSGEKMEGAAVLCVYCRRNLVGYALACLLLRVWSGCVWVQVGGAFPFSECGLWRTWVARTGKKRGQARQVQVRVFEGSVRECRGRSRMTGDRLLYADQDEGIYLKQKVP